MDDLASLSMPERQERLGSSPDGLSQAEAETGLDRYGPNKLTEKKANPILGFFGFVRGHDLAWALLNDRRKLLADRVLEAR